MKVGDLVKYTSLDDDGGVIIGIITCFDEDDDPAVLDLKTGVQDLVWRNRVEVISASR